MNSELSVFPCRLQGAERFYDVIVTAGGGVEALAKDIATGSFHKCSTVVVVTDSNVWHYHGPRFLRAFSAEALVPLVYILEPGEASKSRGTKEAIEDWMLSHECLRDTLVIAFGGGVVGDLAGFVAATYMRGVSVVQVPTTLLAMVDSSIGGKTGLDVPAGKNLVGAFHQPARVVVDTSLLQTLPVRELCNGLAEIVKAGAIADVALFVLLEENADELIGTDLPPPNDASRDYASGESCSNSVSVQVALGMTPGVTSEVTRQPDSPTRPSRATQRLLDISLLRRVIAASIAVKLRVVAADEREGGERAILNFGHTVGHAIEAEEAHASGMLHGEAVSIGMVKEAEIARALGACDAGTVGRLKRLLKAVRLPVTLPRALGTREGVERLCGRMAVDKKNAKDGSTRAVDIKCVLLRDVGAVVAPPYAHKVGHALLQRVLSTAVHVLPPKAVTTVGEVASAIVIRVPGSKSISNRALLLAGLASGTTRIRGVLTSDDTTVMLAALETLGAHVVWDSSPSVRGGGGAIAVVTGTGGAMRQATGARIYVGNAGTASRFLASVLCLPAAVGGNGTEDAAILEGNSRMALRPIGPLVDALREQGAVVEYALNTGCPPLRFLRGISPDIDSEVTRDEVEARVSVVGAETAPAATEVRSRTWRRRLVRLSGRLSSQYVSSILLAAPYFPTMTAGVTGASTTAREADAAAAAAFGADVPYTELLLDETVPTSLPYIQMTLRTMQDFGVKAVTLADNRYLVPMMHYSAPTGIYEVEADASSASYAAALAPMLKRRVVLEGVGSESTQGDAAFPLLLQRMGCSVEQNASITVIDPPDDNIGLTGIDVDMADTTDTFMTLAAVAAVAKGKTRIHGISNQRVKECNRILAMVTELQKLGIPATELPDGIEITGTVEQPSVSYIEPPSIHCYDDHRIAMSFSVLAARLVNGLVIDDAACVEKTFPEWWDIAESKFGMRILSSPLYVSFNSSRYLSMTLPILVIGMRGAGKSTLAAAAAVAFALTPWRYTFIDLDSELEARTGLSCSDFIEKNGWEQFRTLECTILEENMCSKHRTNAVLATGGGIVETETGRQLLNSHKRSGGLVIEVRRDILDIQEDLSSDAKPHRPNYSGGATVMDTYNRRRQWYCDAASHVFHVASKDRDWKRLQSEFASFVLRIANVSLPLVGSAVVASVRSMRDTAPEAPQSPRVTPEVTTGSSFVCIAVRDVLDLVKADTLSIDTRVLSMPSDAELLLLRRKLVDIVRGSDAVEFRVDTLRRYDEDFLMFQLSVLRRSLPPNVPIILTVRTSEEGGHFDGDKLVYETLIRTGLRCGVDCVDLELGPNASHRDVALQLLSEASRYGVPVIASCHWPLRTPSRDEVFAAARACASDGASCIVKLVARAPDTDTALSFRAAAHAAVDALPTRVPCICIAMGETASISRVLNNCLTPTTSDLLPQKAAPGQLSISELRVCRRLMGLRPNRRFVLVGAPIGMSVSPDLQRALFSDAFLDDMYELKETPDASAAAAILSAADGGNVTIPLKESLLPMCATLTPTAATIGAVNTIVSNRAGLHGDNTDWLGIYLALRDALFPAWCSRQPQVLGAASPIVLIVGAGGTAAAAAFAARALGAMPVVHNRTHERGDALAAAFGGVSAPDLSTGAESIPLLTMSPLMAVILTLPASVGWLPPSWLLSRGLRDGAAFLDVAYRPAVTPATRAALEAGWVVATGMDMLVLQGVAANNVWCERGSLLARGIALAPGTRAESGAAAARAAAAATQY